MMRYSTEPRDEIFMEGYGFLPFAKLMDKHMNKNLGQTISKNVSGKYSQELLNHVTQSATGALKTFSKITIKKQQKQPLI